MLTKIKINDSITFFAKLLLRIQDLRNVNKFLTHFFALRDLIAKTYVLNHSVNLITN